MTTAKPTIYIALPAMDELENLPAFMDCVRHQTWSPVRLFVCVNQPDDWWGRVDKLEVCERNRQSLDYLLGIGDVSLEIIDRSSRGFGWKGKRYGVGWARRVLMEAIMAEAGEDDMIVSLDADTTFGPAYLESIIRSFQDNTAAKAMAVPYYHHLTGDTAKDRAILRYEIYMRHYAVNLWRISSPYSFTAIGSAIALPVRSYRAIGGITPHQSGEDFYFLMKLRKYGPVLVWNEEKVCPAARYSDRVGFGTGPAMIRGSQGDWTSYPVYPPEAFDEVKVTYDSFESLFEEDGATPLDPFLLEKFGEKKIWEPLRENNPTLKGFVRSCHLKLDAFRVLQFLKWRSGDEIRSDEENLFRSLELHFTDRFGAAEIEKETFSFDTSPVQQLNDLRDLLAGIEEDYQRSYTLTPVF